MEVREYDENGRLVLVITGKIAATNSEELLRVILNALEKSADVVLDFGELDYMSSSGLRSLLFGQRTALAQQKSMVIRNVGDGVMVVLKSVGFDKILRFE